MLKRVLFVVFLMACLGILFFSGCKTADPASYTLTVTLGNGVSGTPATGSYTYTEDDTVNYSYTAQAGYGNLTVTLDGAPVAASGTIAMAASHNLNVTADIDVRGQWTGRLNYGAGGAYYTVTFSGGVLSGTTSGMFDFVPGTGTGDFTVSGSQINFTLRYHIYGTDYVLECTGTLSDINTMSGDYTWRDDSTIYDQFTWNLARD
jgi:hypothetical protein